MKRIKLILDVERESKKNKDFVFGIKTLDTHHDAVVAYRDGLFQGALFEDTKQPPYKKSPLTNDTRVLEEWFNANAKLWKVET